jgi:2-amino-4-hydroxy-6-hydroxymethyldihydropteridine diphosphokinase
VKTVRAAIALGANLASPEAQVLGAFDEIERLPGTRLLARSSLYRTAPVGNAHQPAFINAAALVDTTLAPRALLDALLAIEHAHGRVRDLPNGPRTLDLDIIAYGDAVIDEPGLAVPHPRAHERAFVLAPLAEIAPGLGIPGHGLVRECLAKCDRSGIAKMEAA